MLFELLPHFARLMPIADRFLASRGASDTTQDAALGEMAESVRGNLGQVAETHAGVQRALQEQAIQLNEIAVEATRTRMGVESIEARVGALDRSMDARVAGLERSAAMAMRLAVAAMVMLVGTVVLLGVVASRLPHR
jgi:hypothetical protein